METPQQGWPLLKKIHLQFFSPCLHPGPPQEMSPDCHKPHHDWNNQSQNNLLLQTGQPATPPKGDWRQTSTGGLTSNSTELAASAGLSRNSVLKGGDQGCTPTKAAEDPTLLIGVALTCQSIGWHAPGMDLTCVSFRTAPSNSQLVSFGTLCADSWLLPLIARQPPLEMGKASPSHDRDHGAYVLYEVLICLPSVVPWVIKVCLYK